MAAKLQNRKTMYTLFFSFIEFQHKGFDQLITKKWRKRWVPLLVGELEPFSRKSSLSRQISHVFNARVHERALMTP